VTLEADLPLEVDDDVLPNPAARGRRARSSVAPRASTILGAWRRGLEARAHANVATVAFAAKLARWRGQRWPGTRPTA
jgi:hypothetical protein